MLHKTRGIVFKYFKYRDTSIIAKILTEQFGLQSYIINGVRSARAHGRIAFYQPLTLLDLVVYKKPNKEINRISQISCSKALKTIPYNIIKSSIGIFLAEILYKCIREDEEVQPMHNFVHHSIEVLDSLEEHYQNFHLQFLIKFSHHLGVGISSSAAFPHITDNQVLESVENLIQSKYNDHLVLDNKTRRIILSDLLSFYQTHIDTLGDIKSLKVLQALFQSN